MADDLTHHYIAKISWTGETRGYQNYSREHRVEIPGKPTFRASADPAFLGDADCHNPEDLLVAALSSCHMLWYLHLSAVKGIVVVSYEDTAEGTMVAKPRDGRFTAVVLRPVVTIESGSSIELATSLHQRAHAECYIANSVNFPVRCQPTIHIKPTD